MKVANYLDMETAAILVVTLIMGFILMVAKRPPPETKVEVKYGGIVRLINREGNALCTGTVVAPNTVLTARHCVLSNSEDSESLPARKIEIRPASNEQIDVYGKVFLVKRISDQALIRGDFREFEVLPVSNGILETNMYRGTVLACGYPLFTKVVCLPLTYDRSELANFDINYPIFVSVMSGPTQIISGMSGGPVLTEDGKVIGVNTGNGLSEDGEKLSFISLTYDLVNDIKTK